MVETDKTDTAAAVNVKTNSSVRPAEVKDNLDRCPCKMSKDVYKIICSTCEQSWHTSCANLKYLEEPGVKELIEWECPRCWSLPFILNDQMQMDNSKLQNFIKDEFDKIEKANKEIAKSVSDEESTGKVKFAELLKQNAEEMKNEAKSTIKSTIADEKSKLVKTAMESSQKANDSNYMEREKRKKNVVLVNAPESTKKNVTDQNAEDRELVLELLQVSEEEIKGLYRAGPPLGEGKNKERTLPRPIIVSLSTPQLAESLHEYGSGKKLIYDCYDGEKKLEIPVYCNKDLILSDRVANYEARQLARNKNKEHRGDVPTNFQKVTESS